MTRRPRVVIASRVFAPEPAAAAYRLRALARALVAAGAEVEVLTVRPVAAPAPAAPDGVRVRRWPVLRDANGAVRGYLPYASFDVPLVGRLLTSARPDVVVAETPPTTGAAVALACAARRIPYVYYAADLLTAAAEGAGVATPVVAGLRALEGGVLRRAGGVVTVSDGVADRIADLSGTRSNVEVVGSGVDTEQFSPSHDEPGGSATPDASETFVYAGTMSEVHGAGIFVDAFARIAQRHPHARMVMYGGGVDREELRRRAEALVPGRVEFPGQVSGAQVAAAFRSARAGLASLRPGGGYEFAFVTKTFAATGCGAPVVYAGPGPCADLVRDNDLGWATAFDADEVAAAMATALATTDTRADRRRRADWTRREASLDAVARRAAVTVLAVAGAARGVRGSRERSCTSSS